MSGVMLVMATGTKDLQTLQAMGDKGQFAIELRNAMRTWKAKIEKKTGRFDIANAEFADAIHVGRAALSRYLNGEVFPDFATCKRIAAVVGPSDDFWLILAQRPNFPGLIERLQRDPNIRKKEDAALIFRLLGLTGDMGWRASHSFWKDGAERALQDAWEARDLYTSARDVAEYILAWTIDRDQRETPFQAREQALAI